MKKILTFALMFCFLLNVSVDAQKRKRKSRNFTSKSSAVSVKRGNYIRGPRGGCYYINRNRNKTYVARSLCN